MKPFLLTSSGKSIQGVILIKGDYFNLLEYRSDIDYTDHPSIKTISNRRFPNQFNYSPASTSYIGNILDHLNPRKAVGVDGISPRILRLGSPVLAEKVAKLINFCMLNRSLPSELESSAPFSCL